MKAKLKIKFSKSIFHMSYVF